MDLWQRPTVVSSLCSTHGAKIENARGNVAMDYIGGWCKCTLTSMMSHEQFDLEEFVCCYMFVIIQS